MEDQKNTFIVSILSCAVVLLMGLNATAASTKSSSKESSQSSSSSDSVNAAVAEGLSLREAMTLNNTNPWSYSASTFSFRSLDYYDDTFWSVGADVSYRIKPGQSLTANISYFEPMDQYDEDPGRFGVSDLDVSWLLPNLVRNTTFGNLSVSVTATAPLSERSKRQSLLGSLSVNGALRKPLSGKLKFLTLSLSGSLVGNHYTYDKTDVFGTDVNSPFGLSLGIAAISRLTQTWTWVNSASAYNRLDYDSNWRTVQTLSSSLSVLINQKIRIFGQYRWRDQVVTNDAFLDDDKSRIAIGGSYFF